jgi:hypothetical protein
LHSRDVEFVFHFATPVPMKFVSARAAGEVPSSPGFCSARSIRGMLLADGVGLESAGRAS